MVHLFEIVLIVIALCSQPSNPRVHEHVVQYIAAVAEGDVASARIQTKLIHLLTR